MTIKDILTLLISSGVLSIVVKFLLDRIDRSEKKQASKQEELDSKTVAVQLGVQALLRDRLIQSYNYYTDKGYAPIYAKENFENMWKQYHDLGQNGVMDSLRTKLHNLPDEKREEEKNG